MKRYLYATVMVAAAVPAFAADVGVSVSVGEPGFYGRIDLGNVPQPPQVIYAQPVVIRPVPVEVAPPPLYLRVPPGHARHWRKHCREYNACERPVYFVQEQWYNEVYVPHYREHGEFREERHGEGHDGDHDHGHGKHKGHDRD